MTGITVLPPAKLAAHEAAVARLRDAYAAVPPGVPVRLAKPTSNLFRFRDSAKPGVRASRERVSLDVSAFARVIHVDAETATAVVGGMTTYEDLCDATLPHGLMPLVVPQLKTITLGGAVTGLGIESTSLWHGLPHESVIEMQILTGDGRVVVATKDNEYSDLYYGFPNSYGTLGYSLALTIELMPVKPYVHLRNFAFNDPKSCMDAIAEIAAGGQLPGPQGGLPRRHRVQQQRAVPDRRGVQRQGALAQRLHRPAGLLQVAADLARGLPHDQGLHLALGHRLVLVLPPVRRAEQQAPPVLAAPVPPLGRLPQAGRAGPEVRADRRAVLPAAPAAAGDGHPGCRDPGRARARVPRVLRDAACG